LALIGGRAKKKLKALGAREDNDPASSPWCALAVCSLSVVVVCGFYHPSPTKKSGRKKHSGQHTKKNELKKGAPRHEIKTTTRQAQPRAPSQKGRPAQLREREREKNNHKKPDFF